MATLNIGADDLVKPDPPRAGPLCLDTSGSMGGSPIRGPSEASTSSMTRSTRTIDAHDFGEINIVEYNSSAGLVHDFASIERLQRISSLTANGATAMGAGVNLSARHAGQAQGHLRPAVSCITAVARAHRRRRPHGQHRPRGEASRRSGRGEEAATVFPIEASAAAPT